MVWAEQEWVEKAERRRGTVATVLLIGLIAVGGALYCFGLFRIDTSLGLLLVSAGLLALLVALALAMAVHPYRRVISAAAPSSVFHVSSALWAEGETVTLEVARCRKKQAAAERWWPRRAHLVYFFQQRPTLRHVRGQTFTRKRRAKRYLYELDLLHPIDTLYVRGPALATPDNVTVTVRSRQELASSLKKSPVITPRD